MFQERKIGAILVEQTSFNDFTNQSVVGASAIFLNPQVIYYQALLGIGKHPESFSFYSSVKYGIDVKRGVVWRLSNDGLTPISEYFQHVYFTELCRQIMLSTTKVNIYGVYDIRFGEYIIAVSAFTYNGVDVPAQTIAFNEKNNAWSTHYSYAPENMVGNGMNIITFKNGGLWKHNENSIQNNFYGVQYASEIDVVGNLAPDNEKILMAIAQSTDLDKVWAAPSITTPNGQESNLIESDFEIKENIPSAAVLFDVNTPNITNPLIEGDTMRDRTFLIKLKYTGTVFSKLFSVNLEYIISNLHNIIRKK